MEPFETKLPELETHSGRVDMETSGLGALQRDQTESPDSAVQNSEKSPFVPWAQFPTSF